MPGLATKTCVPCRGGVPPLKGQELAALETQVDGWNVIEEHHITKTFKFPDLRKALKLTLLNPTTGAVYHTTSDANGAFAFDGISNGTYVLHIDAGKVESDREYEASDHLIALGPTARRDSLLLKRREASGGSCGGTSFELQDITEQEATRPPGQR